MPSPFPGMDPYLESHWGDVHTSMVTYARDQLQKCLPADLRARVEERVVVSGPLPAKSFYPDVRVFGTTGDRRQPGDKSLSVAANEPVLIELFDEPETQKFVEVRDVSSGSRLITVIEILSLSNKMPGEGQEQYLRKQQELVRAGVSLVEIDLLRGGEWVVAIPIHFLAPAVLTPYRAVVRRATRRSQAEYYPIPLSERLPTIKIPLRPSDKDVFLDLQTLLAQCYENGGYDDINYKAAPEPPLSREAARWAARLLTDAGLRPKRRRARKQ